MAGLVSDLAAAGMRAGEQRRYYLDQAQLQLTATDCRPVTWYVQSSDDAQVLIELLAGVQLDQITVVQRSAPPRDDGEPTRAENARKRKQRSRSRLTK